MNFLFPHQMVDARNTFDHRALKFIHTRVQVPTLIVENSGGIQPVRTGNSANWLKSQNFMSWANRLIVTNSLWAFVSGVQRTTFNA